MYKFFVEVGLVLFHAFAPKNFPLFSYFVILDHFGFFSTVPSGSILVFCLMSLLSIFVVDITNLYRTGRII